MDSVLTGDAAERTKPAPDLAQVALETLGAFPHDCVMIGDTPYDGEAARQAGVVFIGVTCGGCGNDEGVLRSAGARDVWRDPAELFMQLDDVLSGTRPPR
ncbi:MAG: HAD-IA family hydrolase [Gemmatimonadaceae bacterium]